MEIWFEYALLSFFVVGIYWFLQKIEAESSLNAHSFIFYAHLGALVFPLIYIIFSNEKIFFDINAFLFGLFINFLYVLALKARIQSLKSLSSSAFFVNYRIFSSSLLIIFGQIIFWENISEKEYLGIFIWFIIFYLLLDKKKKKKKIADMKRGYLYLAVGIVLAASIWIFMKEFVLLENHFITYIFSAWVVGTLWTLALKGKESFSEVLVIKKKKHWVSLVFTSVIFTSWIFLNLKTIEYWGDIAIVYKIISYSLFIPIILSVIVYKEKIWMRKLIAFVLTIVSILLFI